MKTFRIPALIASAAFALAGCATLQQGAPAKAPAAKAAPAAAAPAAAAPAAAAAAAPVESMPMPADAKPPVASGQPNIVKPVFKGEIVRSEFFKLDQPKDIGWSKSGELFVVDRTGILFFDKKDKFTRRIDFKEGWSAPSGCTLDKDGNFLVPFYGEQVIRKLDGNGKLMWEAGYPLAEGKPQNNPNYVVADLEGGYWITDGVRFQLLKGTLGNGRFDITTAVGRVSGSYTAQNRVPTDLPGLIKTVRNPYTGNLYVLLGPSIKVIDPKTGAVVKESGGFGLEPDKFQQASDIFFLKNGNFLVLDGMMNTVKEFDKDFGYLATYADDVRPGVTKLSSNFSSGFTFNEATGRIYVASGMGNRVYIFEIRK